MTAIVVFLIISNMVLAYYAAKYKGQRDALLSRIKAHTNLVDAYLKKYKKGDVFDESLFKDERK
jgi:hypothetical protein